MIADNGRALSFDSDTGEIIIMSGKPLRPDRAELLSRGLALMALLAAVVWAWIDGGSASPG